MHEYSIVQSLVDAVETACGTDIPVRLEVAIGELAGVDTTLLATAFEVFRAGTACERATLEIESVAARWECSRCGAPLTRGAFLKCCDRPARLAAGDEIVLRRIELEVN